MVSTDADTSTRLMDVAERLFGERGIENTSLRDITREAAANVAAVNYHFGSKEGLLRAVFRRRMEPLNEERIRRIREVVDQADGPADLEAILHGFVAPSQEVFRKHPAYMRFVGRLHQESSDFHGRFITEGRFPELVEVMRAALMDALPDTPPGEIWWGVFFLLGAMIHAWAKAEEMEAISGGEAHYGGDEEMIDRLVAFTAAGMRAIPTEEKEEQR